MHIRNATPADLPRFMELYHSHIGTDGITWDEHYPSEEIAGDDIEHGNAFCMVDEEGQILAVVSIEDDEMAETLSCWTKEYSPARYVSRLGVKKGYENRGIAKQMIVHVMQVLKQRGIKCARYLVSPGNQHAIDAYSKMQFVLKGTDGVFGHQWLCYEKLL